MRTFRLARRGAKSKNEPRAFVHVGGRLREHVVEVVLAVVHEEVVDVVGSEELGHFFIFMIFSECERGSKSCNCGLIFQSFFR